MGKKIQNLWKKLISWIKNFLLNLYCYFFCLASLQKMIPILIKGLKHKNIN